MLTLNLNNRKIELLLQGLDCLVTHHNEVGIDVTQVGEIGELAKELQEAPSKWSIPVMIEAEKIKNSKEIGGLGQHT